MTGTPNQLQSAKQHNR